MKRIFRLVFAGAFMSMLFACLCNFNNVLAIDANAVMKKTLLYGMFNDCYQKDSGNDYIVKQTIEFKDGDKKTPGLNDILTSKGQSDKIVRLPNQIGNSVSGDEPMISCKSVFNSSSGKVSGLFQLYGKSFDITRLGFTRKDKTDNSNVGKMCLFLEYGPDNGNGTYSATGTSSELCYAIDKGNLTSKTPEETKRNSKINIQSPTNDLNFVLNVDGAMSLSVEGLGNGSGSTIEFGCPGVVKFSELVKCVEGKLNNKQLSYTTTSEGIVEQPFILKVKNQQKKEADVASSQWFKDDDAGRKALSYFTGSRNRTIFQYSDQEVYDILQQYVKAVMSDTNSDMTVNLDKCYDKANDNSLKGKYAIPNNVDGSWKWCEVDVPDKTLEKVFNIPNSDKWGLGRGTFKDVLTQILKTPDSVNLNGSNVTEVDVAGEGEAEPDCLNSGAGASLGWIVCPILDLLSDASQSMYNEFVEPALRVDPILFQGSLNNGNESGTRQAWGIFRDIANVVFVILFIVVIFSQLTGVGIDNYGIKKILPKLIVAAVLINLSYIICLIAIDLSNILGNGLQAMFNGLASGFTIPISNEGYITIGGEVMKAGVTAESIGTTAITGAAILGIVATGIWATVKTSGGTFGTTILLMLLVTAITIVFSIFFLFVLLGAREAAIIVLTIISPLAFACMILPNTKSLFDKWWKFGRTLLLVYPICGLLVGGGNFVSKLMLSVGAGTGGFFSAFIAMIVGVVPIFFIPTVLKNAIAAMGMIGGKLSGLMAYGKSMGQKVGGNTRGVITGSERYKDWSQFQQNQRGVRRARRIQNKLEGRLGNGQTLSAKQQAQLRKAQDVVLAQRKTDQENAIRASDGYADAMMYKQDMAVAAETDAIARLNDPTVRAAEAQSMEDEARLKRDKARTSLMLNQTQGEGLNQLMARWNTAFDSGNSDDLSALTNVINQRYGSSGASSIAGSLNNKHGIANNPNYQASMRTLQQTMSDNSSFAGNMKTKSPDAFQMIGDAGMRFDQTANNGAGGMIQEDMRYFTENNQTATKVSDWANVSGATLQRAIDSGENGISSDMIRRLLESEDPSVVSGLQSEQGKREALEAALYNRSGTGPNLDNATAANNYRTQQAQQQADNELYIQHEQDATRRGKVTINVPPTLTGNGGGTTISGYAVPAGFNTGGQGPQRNQNGDYIYTDINNGRRWNANTGRYVR